MAIGSKIYTTDYNTIRNKVVQVLGVGGYNPSGVADSTFGYGQTPESTTVTSGAKVASSKWVSLRADLIRTRQFQTGNIETLPNVSVGNKLTNAMLVAFSAMADNIVTDHAGAGFPIASQANTAEVYTESNSLIWDTIFRQDLVVTFASADEMRYFFNSGSRFKFTASHTNLSTDAKNTSWTTLLSNIGTIEFGRVGYAAITTSDVVFFTQTAASPYNANSYSIKVRKDSSLPKIYFTVSCTAESTVNPTVHYDGTISTTMLVYRAHGAYVIVNAPTITSSKFLTPQLSAPVVTGVNGDQQVTFNWSAVDQATDYTITWLADNTTTTQSTLSYTKTGLSVDTQYGVSIIASATNFVTSNAGTANARTFVKIPDFVVTGHSATNAVYFTWPDLMQNVIAASGYIINGTGSTYIVPRVDITNIPLNTTRSITVTAVNPGVYTASNAIAASATSSAKLSIPVSVSSVGGDRSVTFDWNSVVDATGYTVTWVADGSTYDRAGNTTTSYTRSSLTPGTQYSITVVAYSSIVGAISSDPLSMTATSWDQLQTPTFVSGQVYGGDRTVHFSWNAVSSATKYYVNNVDNGASTTYDLTVNPSTTVDVSIYAYASGYTNSGTLTGSATSYSQLATPSVSGSGSDSYVSYSWPAVTNASGYTITWNGTLIGNQTSTSYGRSGSNGTSYSISVVAYASGYTSSGAGTASATATAPPLPDFTFTITAPTITPSSITWSFSDGDSFLVSFNGGGYAWHYSRTYSQSSLTPSTSYSLSVLAFKSGYNSASASKTTSTIAKWVLSQPSITDAQSVVGGFRFRLAPVTGTTAKYQLQLNGQPNGNWNEVYGSGSGGLVVVDDGHPTGSTVGVIAYSTIPGSADYADSPIVSSSGTALPHPPLTISSTVTGSYTVPSGYASASWTIVAPGGGGGGGTVTQNGGGGEGGEIITHRGEITVTGGTVLSWTVGSPGAGGTGDLTNATAGGTGGAVTISRNGTLLDSKSGARGGAGGVTPDFTASITTASPSYTGGGAGGAASGTESTIGGNGSAGPAGSVSITITE